MSDILDILENLIAPSIANEVNKTYHPYKVNYLQDYANKLSKVSDNPNLSYNAYVIPGDTINAFAIPGGYVYFYEGLVKNFSKKIIAGVIGHEIAHVAKRHCLINAVATYGIDYIGSLITQQDVKKLTELILTVLKRGYSRENEYQADKGAVLYNYKADLYPYGIKKFLEWLVSTHTEKEESLIEELLRTHPYSEDRLKRVNEQFAELDIKEKSEIFATIQPYLIPASIGIAVFSLFLAIKK